MSLYDEMSRDFLSVWEEVPAFLYFKREKVRVVVSQDTMSNQLELGGFADRNTLSARLLRVEKPDALAIGTIVKIDDGEYRVESIIMKPTSPIITLNLIQL